MRATDLIGLAVFALARHPLRTTLTTLGVLFGTLVLVGSVATLIGVQDTIIRQASKYSELRRIEVHPGAARPVEKDKGLPGAMSDARRQRLQAERRSRAGGTEEVPPERRLTPDRVRELGALPHVRRAEPVIRFYGDVRLGDASQQTHLLAIPADLRANLRGRLVAGSLPADEEEGAVVSEMMLYELGLHDEVAQAQALGRRITFELSFGERPRPRFLVTLLTGRWAAVRPSEEAALAKVLTKLPGALDRLGLSPEEERDVQRLLGAKEKAREAPSPYRFHYPIRGILRGASAEETRRRGAWALNSVDLLVSRRSGAELFARLPWGREQGYGEAILEVDDPANVKAVQEELRQRGLRSSSAVEFIEREQFIYLVVFAGMTVVALIALLVAALGIMNTMLMSVLERTREIGIMKAVGARDGHVQALFLMEGALIGVLGGALGLLAAWGVSHPADAWLRRMVAERMKVPLDGSLFAFPWWLTVGAPLFAILLTTLAAWWPARRAVRIDPVEALRHE